MNKFHKPVLLKEILDYLNIKGEGKYIDATLGGGGHTKAILSLGGNVLGLDRDPEAIKSAREYLSTACPIPDGRMTKLELNTSWCLAKGNFKDLKKIAQEHNFEKVDGILFDLGVSSHQLDTPERGFSFKSEAPLDMRMDPDLNVTAADLINGLGKKELEKLFLKYGEEKNYKAITKAILMARKGRPIKEADELAKIIERVKFQGKSKIHPATKVFQALRIAVNDELNNLKESLPQARDLLNKGGRLAIISFHSLEDKIVKDFLKGEKELLILTKKPIVPQEEEIKENKRSRSAKLRVAEKI